MIDFSVPFNLISFCIVAGLAVIMLLANVIMLFRLRRGRASFFGILVYIITWLIMLASLTISTIAVIHRFNILNVENFVKLFGAFIMQLVNLTLEAYMMEFAFYALAGLSIIQLVLHPFSWMSKKEYATPVIPADGDGYITVDEAFKHFDDTAKEDDIVIPDSVTEKTETVIEPTEVEEIEVTAQQETVVAEEVAEPVNEEMETVNEETTDGEPIIETPNQPTEEVEQAVDEPTEEVEQAVDEPTEEEPFQDEIVAEEPIIIPPAQPTQEETTQDEPIIETPNQPTEEVVDEPTEEVEQAVDETIEEEPIQDEIIAEEPIIISPVQPIQEEPVTATPVQTQSTKPEVKAEEPKVEVKTMARPSRKGGRIVAAQNSETGKRKRVTDDASAMFAEYLKDKTEEEQAQIKEAIDRVVIGKGNGKK